MCRWLAYRGSPVRLDDLLLKPTHSLIDQSLHSKMGATTTNGDGFGIGWYGDRSLPGVFHSTDPAWNDRNLKEIAQHLVSPLVFAHVRASTGGAIQQSNCHPFRFEHWLWMHNGLIRDFANVKREIAMAIDPSLFAEIEGSTDSEYFFYLALSMGLRDDPVAAVERAVWFIEDKGRRNGVMYPIQMTVATTDGAKVWVFRYSSEGRSRTLFYSTDVATMREQYPDNPMLHSAAEDTRLVVSEPFGSLEGAWNEVPESTYGIIQAGDHILAPFKPRAA